MDRFRRLRNLRRVQNLRRICRPRLVDADNPLESLQEREFFRRYRFSKQLIVTVIFKLVEDIVTSAHGLQLPPVLVLLAALRFFATGAFQLLVGDSVKVSQSSVHRMIKKVAHALARHRKNYIKFPTPEEAPAVRTAFTKLGRFPGIIGAIDCTHIQISSPGGHNAEVFRNRKGYFSLNVQAVCTSDLLFTNLVARWKGSTHDSRIFNNSRLSVQLKEKTIPGNLIGDGGYELLPYLFTPYKNVANGTPDQRYNKAHAKTRNPIERAFGVLKRRFYCVGGILRTKMQTTIAVIVACFILHNIGIQYAEPWEEEEDTEPMQEDEPEINNVPESRMGKLARDRIRDNYYL